MISPVKYHPRLLRKRGPKTGSFTSWLSIILVSAAYLRREVRDDEREEERRGVDEREDERRKVDEREEEDERERMEGPDPREEREVERE